MKTIAIANQKGGTGKTTTAYNLGIALTQQGYRVLMVDFDPQGNLSCYCGIPPEQDLEQTITELLMKVAYEKPLSHRECVYQSKRTDDSAPQVDFIPPNLRLASFELAMGTMMCREVLLKTCLEQYSSQYDYCIIDCSPSVGLLRVTALPARSYCSLPRASIRHSRMILTPMAIPMGTIPSPGSAAIICSMENRENGLCSY